MVDAIDPVETGAPPPPLIVAGASGHAAVVIEIVRAEGRYRPIGCISAGGAGGAVLGVPILGDDGALAAARAAGVRHAIVAIGDNRIRMRVGAELRAGGFALVNAIHPAAIVSPSVRFGEGIVVMAGAVVNARAAIGDLAILNTRSGVDHDCTIGIGAHVGPGATLSGTVRVGDGAFVGAATTVVPGLGIGAWSTIGAGSLVLRDIAPGTVAYGIPARPRAGG